MAKKKNRAKSTRRAQSTKANQITAHDRARGRQAMKTMIKGAIGLALFICFFALKIGDETAYERAQGLFADDSATSTTSTPDSALSK